MYRCLVILDFTACLNNRLYCHCYTSCDGMECPSSRDTVVVLEASILSHSTQIDSGSIYTSAHKDICAEPNSPLGSQWCFALGFSRGGGTKLPAQIFAGSLSISLLFKLDFMLAASDFTLVGVVHVGANPVAADCPSDEPRRLMFLSNIRRNREGADFQ